jgi:hypothetical protein
MEKNLRSLSYSVPRIDEGRQVIARTILLFLALVFQLAVFSQVTFTNQSGLLGATGNSSYEDCAVDVDGDGLDDVVRVTNGTMYIDYQQPGGTFTQQSWSISPNAYPSWSLCAGDLNADGTADFCFGGGSAVTFLLSDGVGGWIEQDQAGYIFSQRSTMADIDNDGDLDAFVCHDVDLSHPYANDGSGNMVEDQSLISTVDQPGNYAALWVDYDNDWDTDLYVTKCRQGASPGDPFRTNRMYRNNGDGTYTEVAPLINMDDNSQTWATVFEDFDNDGDFDSFSVNHDFTNRFMQNDGTGNFTDIIGSTDIDPNDLGAWECYAADFDNDGFVDILSEMDDELLMNDGDLTFTYNFCPFTSGGIGDLNNDGFLDCIRGNTLWINDGNTNNYVKVDLEGVSSNKDGIGARIEIHGAWGMQIREVRSGQSFSPMQSLTAHFGIGDATAIDQIVIKWPSGIQTVIDDPAINTTHNIPEADCLLGDVPVTPAGPHSLCPGGDVILSAPAGYTDYLWSTGETTESITVSAAGNYSCMVTDALACLGVSNAVEVSIQVPTAPTASAAGPLEFCEGGSVMLSATPGASYLWSNGEVTQDISAALSDTYTVDVTDACGDVQTSNSIDVVVVPGPGLPDVVDVVIPGPGSATFNGTSDNLLWYDAIDGVVPVGTGNTYMTPVIATTTSYWVEDVAIYGGVQAMGAPDSTDNEGAYHTNSNNYLIFDAHEEFILKTVKVYANGAGNRTINVIDDVGATIHSGTYNLPDGESIVTLDYLIPAGTGYGLRSTTGDPQLWRWFDTTNGAGYPYDLGTLCSITSSSIAGANQYNYYYFFYDWQIETPTTECVGSRIEVVATVAPEGCTDPAACNYDPGALVDDGSCDYSCNGCTDPGACNYSVLAINDDGSCYYNCLSCQADFNNDGEVNTPDLLVMLAQYGCGPPNDCPLADFNEDGIVNVSDLLSFLSAFDTICDQ